ncbi:MAG: hypothetical protein M1837_005110 [Sclerophora amabilis]|nr:MAG: hypothetical protein M1837_005110 [Sclerophora amabilis]
MATIASARTSLGGSSSSMGAQNPGGSSHPFTCNTCQVAFRSSELQRGHMHSDWHRYNLKRRVASLPPLSTEIFTEKVLTAQASSNAAAAKASYERVCQACEKVYYSQNAFQNHLGSQKHKVRVIAVRNGAADDESNSVISSTFSLGEPIDTIRSGEDLDSEADAEFSKVVNGIKETSIQGDEPVSRRPSRPHHSAAEDRPQHPISESSTPSVVSTSISAPPAKQCLFCGYNSPSLNLNVLHMEKIHGMFLPERPFLVNLEGLISYLHNKISEFHECLFCGKLKNTTVGVQTHMRDKGHCMIAFESEGEMIEVGQFYDFRSTYSDEEGSEDMDDETTEEKATSGIKLGAKRSSAVKSTAVDSNGDAKALDEDGEFADGWETDSSASSLDSADLTAVPLDHTPSMEKLQKHLHHSRHDPRPHHNTDGWHSHAHAVPHAAYYSDYELHLPSGRAVGHRSLARYYRQNLHNYSPPGSQPNRQAITESADSEHEARDSRQRGNRGRELTSRGSGGLGMVGVSDAKRKEVQSVEKRERRRANRHEKRYQWGVEKRGNMQKHFRDPLLQ